MWLALLTLFQERNAVQLPAMVMWLDPLCLLHCGMVSSIKHVEVQAWGLIT